MSRLILAISALSLLTSSAAIAKDVSISFSGCVFRGVEGGCLMVRSGLKTYNITGTQPAPAVGRAIAGAGALAGGVGFCMQGNHLKDVHWHYIRMHCPPIIAHKSS
jgi:hypothetical protein